MLAAIRHGRFDDHVQKLMRARAVEGVPSFGDNHGDHALEDLSQSLDEMVSEFLGAETPPNLTVVLESVEPPRAGQESEIALQALSMPGSRRIGGAEVKIEMISPFEAPRLLASGHTDEDGCWRQRLLVPDSAGGLAALIVAVHSPLGDAEEKILL
jgi:hypothetical protein